MKTLRELFTGSWRNEKSETLEQQENQGMVHSGSSIDLSKTQLQYRCPMGCEGDKTYDSPGNCPVCNMKLAVVSGNSSSSHVHEHGHEGHGHGHHGCC